MMIEPLIKELLEAGVHFGHQTHRWNPKMKRFIFGEKNGIYIVDLEKTAKGLGKACDFLRGVAAQGGPILFVGTKRQAQSIIQDEAVRCGQYFVNLRWLGGLLTNFQTVKKSIERYKTLRSWREEGSTKRMTKKEASQADKEMSKLERGLKGILEMPRLPKAIYLIDAKREETAVQEAVRLGIPVVGLVDTNSNPDPISFIIPGNDDAIRSIQLVTHLLADAILEGHQSYLTAQAEEAAKRAPKVEIEEKPELPVPQEAAVAAEAQTGVLPELAVPPVDEVEQIIPDATLKTKVEAADKLKRKKATTIKAAPKEAEKEEGPVGG